MIKTIGENEKKAIFHMRNYTIPTTPSKSVIISEFICLKSVRLFGGSRVESLYNKCSMGEQSKGKHQGFHLSPDAVFSVTVTTELSLFLPAV